MKKYKFKAKIEAGDGGGAYVLFPYDTEKEFATKGKVPVKATFNGISYAGSLIKYGKPLPVLGMPKAIREQTGKGPGDTIEVIVWRDEEARTVEVPAQFEKLIKKEGLLPVFEKLSSELLTWLFGNLSAFCVKTGGCDHIVHLKPGAGEQRVCFVESMAKGFGGTRPMWRTERGQPNPKLVIGRLNVRYPAAPSE